jgi:hypothetical protein
MINRPATTDPLLLRDPLIKGKPLILKTCNIFNQEDNKINGKQRRQSDKQLS